MADTLAVAKYLNDLYKAETGHNMTQSRLLNMMYFIQRESIISTPRDATLFAAQFKGWSYGPVLTMVRDELKKGTEIHSDKPLSDDDKKIVEDAFNRYHYSLTSTLERLIHEEFSWQYSRTGLSPYEKGDASLLRDAICVDAVREEIRRELEAQDHE